VSSRTGLGAPEVAALAAVAELGGMPAKRRRGTALVLEAVERETGLAPRYAHQLLQDLALPWRLHLPLLDPGGNWGSRQGDPAASARSTEVRLSEVGALALVAERHEVGPVPLGLIEGTLYRGGPVPPFAPARVLDALTSGGADAGHPAMPTGGIVAGGVSALLAGRRARLVLGSTIVREPGQLVITEIPMGVTVDELREQLSSQVRGQSSIRFADYLPDAVNDRVDPPFPVVDVRDESSGPTGIRVVCALRPRADVGQAERWVRSVWPVTIEVDCRLPAPMRRRLLGWDRGDGSGLAALRSLVQGLRDWDPARASVRSQRLGDLAQPPRRIGVLAAGDGQVHRQLLERQDLQDG
jgi:hypothetical protein